MIKYSASQENLVSFICPLFICDKIQEDVEAEIAKVEDVTETEFAAIERDAKSIIEASIDAVRDLEETDFAAEPRDAEVML